MKKILTLILVFLLSFSFVLAAEEEQAETCEDLIKRSQTVGERAGEFVIKNFNISEAFDGYSNTSKVPFSRLEQFSAESYKTSQDIEERKTYAAVFGPLDIEKDDLESKALSLNCDMGKVYEAEEQAYNEQLCGADLRAYLDDSKECDVQGTGAYVAAWDILRLSRWFNLSQTNTIIAYAVLFLALYWYIFKR